jgi:hypothetical protein
MAGRQGWRSAYQANIKDNTPEGTATREKIAALFDTEQRKVTEISGIESGYRYVNSPIVWQESSDGPDPDNHAYVPTTWPGARLPHVWLSEGIALHDRLGPGYTLLKLGGTKTDTSSLKQSFLKMHAPLDVLEISSARAREIYEYDLLLVRPDLHVAWRGNKLSDADAAKIAMIAMGQ